MESGNSSLHRRPFLHSFLLIIILSFSLYSLYILFISLKSFILFVFRLSASTPAQPGQAVDVVCGQPDEQAVALLAKESWDRCELKDERN